MTTILGLLLRSSTVFAIEAAKFSELRVNAIVAASNVYQQIELSRSYLSLSDSQWQAQREKTVHAPLKKG